MARMPHRQIVERARLLICSQGDMDKVCAREIHRWLTNNSVGPECSAVLRSWRNFNVRRMR
jgi:hypothetical protein